MEPYIKKADIVAEIERRINELSQLEKASYEVGLSDAYKIVLSFLDTLEVKEVEEEPVSNDLEEAIKKYLTSLRKSHFEGYDIERAFKKGAQWQKKQTENDDEKLSKAVKLADAMYYAAHQLTTDASHLMETMKDWWNFKNVELNNKE